jgi:hypothetical protein
MEKEDRMDTVFPCFRRLTRIFVLTGLVLGAVSSMFAAVVYDFVQKAPEAKWARALSAPGELPWNGSDGDGRRVSFGWQTTTDPFVYALYKEK